MPDRVKPLEPQKTPIRLFVEAALGENVEFVLGAMQSNYMANVMRLPQGAQILVFNGSDGEWLAEIEAGGRAVKLRALRQIRPQSSGPDIHYLFAPLKRDRLDYMVQKATEMGVAALRPVMTRRTVAERVNAGRMRANAIEAAEQCGVLRVPAIHAPDKLNHILDDWAPSRRLIYCDEAAPIASPWDALQRLAPGPLAVLIGPEGGFDPLERERLSALPYVTAISLGPRIMRADTAAVAALALVNATLGDWRA